MAVRLQAGEVLGLGHGEEPLHPANLLLCSGKTLPSLLGQAR